MEELIRRILTDKSVRNQATLEEIATISFDELFGLWSPT